jgi:light-regulated signal transduction histidine kinase (bacteriophytochrome)
MAASSPAFGQADLSNCEREQIHLAGSIQPHGLLLRVDEPDLRIVQASANAGLMLGCSRPLVGVPLARIEGDIARQIRPYLTSKLDELPIAVRCHAGHDRRAVDCLLHRPASGGLVIELERAGPMVDLSRDVDRALQTLVAASSLRVLCDDIALIFKQLTGYDRVMVYRFDEEGHGEVYAEERELELEAFLGNRYPASDIPKIARRLYQRTRVRVLVDVAYEPAALEPDSTALGEPELDMSLCFLRSMSPIHIQYLKNMGVNATLVVSLMVGGRLWGLIACHHYAPRFVHYETRAAAELLAEAIGVRIAALESVNKAQAELSVRRLEQRMIEIISREGDWRTALFDRADILLQPLGAVGAALLFEGQITTAGEVPGTQDLRDIGAWLDHQPRAAVIATKSLGLDQPELAHLKSIASGLIATPVSRSAGEYLIWFRPERVRTITWGGNPFKPVVVGDDPATLSPRRSFAQWRQQVEGTSDSWTATDHDTARLIGDTVGDVALQFRSVRMLIAQAQVEQVSHQVKTSEQPVLIADAGGRVLLTNQAFDQQIAGGSAIRSITDLASRFTAAEALARTLGDLTRNRRAWRGEVTLRDGPVDQRPFLMRADPVAAAPSAVMGFVLLFTDLGEQKAAESARQRFQEEVIARHRMPRMTLDSKADLLFRNILSSVVGNAQLAALEITDSMDMVRMPAMLESISHSVHRSAGLLEHLLAHAARSACDDDEEQPEAGHRPA